MAKAERNSNVTWIWVREAHPAILRFCGSPQLCSTWLAEKIASGQIRWKYQAPPIVDAQNFWQPTATGKFPEIDFEQNLAARDVVTDTPGVIGMARETIYGLAISREDLEALGPEIREDDNLSPSFRSLVSGLLPFFRGGGRDAPDRRQGVKGVRISELARLRWSRTNGRPPESLDNDQVWRSIAADYEARYGTPVPDRTTILRNSTIGRLPRR
jgi:hypothetical protein